MATLVDCPDRCTLEAVKRVYAAQLEIAMEHEKINRREEENKKKKTRCEVNEISRVSRVGRVRVKDGFSPHSLRGKKKKLVHFFLFFFF